MFSVIFIIISVIIQSLNAATPTEFVKLIEYVRFAQNNTMPLINMSIYNQSLLIIQYIQTAYQIPKKY